MGIGKRIKQKASEAGLNLKTVAKEADIPYTTLYSIVKRDSERVDPSTLTKIAEALNVSMLKLATGEESFGDRLKRIREQKNFSVEKLSEQTKISETAIQMYESGEIEPGVEITKNLAETLDITIEELTGKSWQLPTMSDKIIFSRKQLGKSQEEIAEAADMPPEKIRKFEEDILQPTYREIQKLALVLDITMDELIDPAGIGRIPKRRCADEQLQKNKRDMLGYFSDLTPAGQLEASKSIKLLLRIPEYHIHTAGEED